MLAGTRGFFSALAFAASVGLPATAHAQSLSLSYGLDPAAAAQAPKVSPHSFDRCWGVSWAATLVAACNAAHALVHRVVASATGVESAAAAAPESAPVASRRVEAQGTYSAVDVQPPRLELPQLGSPGAEGRVLRAGESSAAASRGMDVNLRFGSRYRMRNGDEGWETYRLNDATTENRAQSSGMRNVGVELSFPFQ